VIKAVFLDIDNTLTSSVTRTIPKSARAAVARAREKGIRVFVCTGRNPRTPEEGRILDGLPLDGHVALNGQLIYFPGEEPFYCRPLPETDVETTFRFCREREIPLMISEPDRNYINLVDDRVREFQGIMQIPLYDYEPVESLAGRTILSLTPFANTEEEKALLAILTGSESVRFNPYCLDLIPKGGGKDVGMEIMAARFGIALEECLAMGDGGNDIAMLRAAGVGVAMAGSEPAVLAAADEIAPSPDEDGILRTFEKHGLV